MLYYLTSEQKESELNHFLTKKPNCKMNYFGQKLIKLKKVKYIQSCHK
jgi:hypothetical protein